MGVSGKKAKAKDKTGKAGAKQKIKKSKSPEATEDQTITESSAPGSPELVLQEPELGQSLDPALQQATAAADFTGTRTQTSPAIVDNEEGHEEQPSGPSNEQLAEKNDYLDDQVSVSTTKDTREPHIESDEEPYPTDQSYPTEHPERALVASPFAPFSPAPALVPLPSPSLTEARFMSSASPEAHYYPYYPPPPLPFAPYAAPVYSPPTYYSPIPKVSSPLARSRYPYMSPIMSPTATPPPPPPAPAVPMALSAPSSTAQSYTTAIHSPVLSSAGMVPPYAPYTPPQPPDSHFMHRSYSASDQSYTPSFQAIRDLNLNNGQVNENGTISPPENDQEHIELLQRIQSAIPDINRLLHGFRHTHTRLNSREAEMKQIGNQHEQALMHKDFYIEALQAQMKKTANESAEECAKLKNTINELRLELGDLQEKQKDLEDGLAGHQKSNEELSQSKSELEAEIEKLHSSLKDAQDAHEKEREAQKNEHAKALTTQKQELTELFEEIKNEDEKAASETLEAREKDLREEHDSAKEEWEKEKKLMEETLETQRGELEATKSELASKIATLETQETEREMHLAELNTTREEVASKVAELEAKEKELEETREKSVQELDALQQGHTGELDGLRQGHASELDTLQLGHASELDSLQQSHNEQLAAAATELNEKIASVEAHFLEQQQHWEAERAALRKLLAEKDEELTSAEREKDKLEGDGLIKEQQLQRAVQEMRSTIDHLDQDCDRLRKTLLSLGEATDLKTTKGDQFFVDCFTQLSQLISELSNEHFAYLPIDPPKDILSKIPSELPSFLDNTPASRALRAAYIQHVVSKTLTYRVFQPFLFTLGRRYDKADTFFQMLSLDIRRKSVRREAFWRQQTLKAAYTTSDAKQSINVAAAVIVDEIIDHIRHFADPRQLDPLLTAVRKIVKLAAETWRHARVERELVLALFPAPDAETVANHGWAEYGAAASLAHEDHPAPTSGPARHVVLRTFPRVFREPAHEDFASGPDRATSCIYSAGEVLFSDSPVVMARLRELAKKSTETLVAEEEGLWSPPKTPKGEIGDVDLAGAPVEQVSMVREPSATFVRSPPAARSATPVKMGGLSVAASPRAEGQVVPA
ncbi:uncharacterized protein N7482_005352 [Penicillium canariense]|uniref:RNA polymerase Rpb1 C-terminal repeat domain-containing protein n=1 Tax=Penicillium canariense TaxID=189055 RepID=A0A9W9LMX9_9EURO|nr:uncharacterized protein N7482_005352 [Penicillium canariense]KAJ5166571.1 hypothetical protein N7482_005352 [Penicillium canariense]